MLDVARDGAHDGAGRFGGPDRAEPCRTLGDDRRDVGHGLYVVDQYGWREAFVGVGHAYVRRQTATGLGVVVTGHDFHDPSPVRRRDAGKRRAAVDPLEQRGLLAVEVFRRAFADVDLDVSQPAG